MHYREWFLVVSSYRYLWQCRIIIRTRHLHRIALEALSALKNLLWWVQYKNDLNTQAIRWAGRRIKLKGIKDWILYHQNRSYFEFMREKSKIRKTTQLLSIGYKRWVQFIFSIQRLRNQNVEAIALMISCFFTRDVARILLRSWLRLITYEEQLDAALAAWSNSKSSRWSRHIIYILARHAVWRSKKRSNERSAQTHRLIVRQARQSSVIAAWRDFRAAQKCRERAARRAVDDARERRLLASWKVRCWTVLTMESFLWTLLRWHCETSRAREFTHLVPDRRLLAKYRRSATRRRRPPQPPTTAARFSAVVPPSGPRARAG